MRDHLHARSWPGCHAVAGHRPSAPKPVRRGLPAAGLRRLADRTASRRCRTSPARSSGADHAQLRLRAARSRRACPSSASASSRRTADWGAMLDEAQARILIGGTSCQRSCRRRASSSSWSRVNLIGEAVSDRIGGGISAVSAPRHLPSSRPRPRRARHAGRARRRRRSRSQRGEIVGLVGESGCGKSITARSIAPASAAGAVPAGRCGSTARTCSALATPAAARAASIEGRR